MTKGNHYTKNNECSIETVLSMQAGGSLGAYECGAFKSLVKHNIWFDIIAGNSIGSVNAAIIVDAIKKAQHNNNYEHTKDDNKSKLLKEAAKKLEHFWLDSADNITPRFLPFKVRSYISAGTTFVFGHPYALDPIWFYPGGPLLNNGFTSPYLYDTLKFKQVLNKTINFENLLAYNNDDKNDDTNDRNKNSYAKNDVSPRLILSGTDVQTAENVIFDTNTMDITAEQICGCIAYPFYGLKWTKIDDRYIWDGGLINSTPLTAVIRKSPYKEKRVFVIDAFPTYQQKLPNNFAETWHRARDIIFRDKSDSVMDVSDYVKSIFSALEEMHDFIMHNINVKQDKKVKDRFENLEKKYSDISSRRGRIINDLIHIKRNEDEKSHHSLFEDWDYSIETIRELIRQGEKDADSALEDRKSF